MLLAMATRGGEAWRAGASGSSEPGRTFYVVDPLADVQAVIDSAGPGDTVLFGAGTFLVRREAGLVIQNKRRLTIIGQGRRTVIKMAPDVDYGFQVRDGVHGLTITHLAVEGSPPFVPPDRVPSGIATQDGVHDSGVSLVDLDIGYVDVGIRVGGGVAGVYDSVLVAGNTVHDVFGTAAGSGYGIHNDNGSNVLIAGNLIRGVRRHSIYQARGDRSIVIRDNLILDHGRGHPITTNVALAVARSSHVTVANNIILDPYTRALSVEPDDRPWLSWPVDHVYLINNRIIGFRDIGIWLSQSPAGREIVGWGNVLVRAAGNQRPGVADSRGIPVALPAPPYWSRTEAMTSEGQYLYVMRDDTLYQVAPRYGRLPDSTWITGRSPTRWRDFQALTGGGDGFLYVIQNGALHRVNPRTWVDSESPRSWRDVGAVAGLHGSLYVIAGPGPSLYRVNPIDWGEDRSGSTWPGVQAMAAWGESLYVMRGDCTYVVDPRRLVYGLLGPCYPSP